MTFRLWMAPSIRGKLLLSFALLVTAIGAFVLAFFPGRFERQAMNSVEAKAEAIRQMTAYSVSAGMVFGDTEAVGDVLAGASIASDVTFAVVHDLEGRVLVSVGGIPESAPGVIASGASEVTDDGLLYITSQRVLHGGEELGTLSIGVSLASLREEVADLRRLGLVVAALISLLGYAAVFAISTLVTRPLVHVAETVQRIVAGDLATRAEVPSDLEAARLVRAFNHMVDGLASAQAELSRINQQLEARVLERTAKLRRAVRAQKRARVALSASESQARSTSEMLRSLIDVAPQAIVAVDPSWRVIRWNRAAETLFGWTADEVLGEPIPFHAPGRHDVLLMQQQLAEGGPALHSEVECVRKDGAVISVLLAGGVLRDPSELSAGYILVVADLTERKSLEEQLRQSQKMQAVGRLAGGIAHDFNNVLTVITASVAMLLESERSAEDLADLEAIATSSARASALTRQLLMFTRKQVVNHVRVSASTVVAELLPMLRRLIRENIRIDAALEDGSAEVMADPVQLEQVLMNLVVNASDAMPDGGTLTLRTAVLELDASYAAMHPNVSSGRYMQLTVRDTGVGMSDATLGRLFEPFFTTKEVGQGTGLGLATAYATVTQLGGHIQVQSTLGEGSVFEVFIPLIPRAEVEAQPTCDADSMAAPPAPARVTILLVEDEEGVRVALRRLLQRLGHTVLEASDGESALLLVAAGEDRIQLVLTDIMMPGMNGRDFADQFLLLHPNTPVIFMSGYTGDAISRTGLIGESHTFLQKPFDLAVLSRTIQELVGCNAEAVLA